MNRRRFFGAAGLAAASAAWPAWLKRAFADVSIKDAASQPAGELSPAQKRAQSLGKPLLVLIVPANESAAWQRGRDLGALLNAGTDEQMAPLALAEVVCAPMSEVRRVAPTVGDGEPLMVLLDAGSAQRLDGTPAANTGDDEDAVVDRRIDVLARLLRSSLAGPIAARAARARAALPRDEVKTIDALLDDDQLRISPAMADRAAALVEEYRQRHRARERDLTRLLAAAAALRLRDRPPTGSHWARDSMCGGPTIEGMPDDQAEMVDCGMGHIPKKSSRFLYFYSRTPSQRRRDAEKKG